MSVLVIVDMVNDFLKPGGALYCGDDSRRIIGPLVNLAEQFYLRGDPVIFVNDLHQDNDPEFKLFGPHCLPNTEGAERIEEFDFLDSQPDLLIDGIEFPKTICKFSYSAWHGTTLHTLLKYRLGECEVWLAGVCTGICILFTSFDMVRAGYEVKVPRYCVADFDPDRHEMALDIMNSILGVPIL